MSLGSFLQVHYALLVLAAISAALLTRRRRAYAPIAALLAWGIASDLGQTAIRVTLAEHREAGLVAADWRWLLTVAQGLHTSWPIAITWFALVLLLDHDWQWDLGARQGLGMLAVLGWLGLTAALSFRYASQPPGQADPLYGYETAACAILGLAIVAAWLTRTLRAGARPAPEQWAALALVLGDVALLAAGPYWRGDPVRDWILAAPSRWSTWAALCVLQFISWRKSRSGPSSEPPGSSSPGSASSGSSSPSGQGGRPNGRSRPRGPRTPLHRIDTPPTR